MMMNTKTLLVAACILGALALVAIELRSSGAPPAVPAPTARPLDTQPVPALGREGALAPSPPAAPSHAAHPLDARLVATILRSDSTASFAAIERLDGTGGELVGPGDALASDPDARVLRIEDGIVDIDHAGEIVRLTATSHLDPRAEAFLEAVRNAPIRPLSDEERARRADLAERLRARMQAGPGSGTRVRGSGLFEDGEVRSHYDGDRLTAVELADLAPDGFYDRVGFESGDQVSSINGIPIGDADAGARILRELATSDEIVVDVTHAEGDAGAVTISTAALLEELRAQFPGGLPEGATGLEDLPIHLEEWTSGDDTSLP